MSPSHTFTATFVSYEDQGDCAVVSLADDAEDPRDYLIFQRAYEFTQQDIQLGMDAVHVERNGQVGSGYGGLRRVTLSRERLTLELDERGAELMDGTTFMREDLDLSIADSKKLCVGLRACFEGMSFYADEVGLG